MFKKILTGIIAVMFFATSFAMVGCSSSKNYNTDGVISNGGMALIKDGYMYYIAGGTDEFEEPTTEMIKSASIYKRPVDAKGNPVDGATPELVYSGIAGFEYGGLYMFGEYLYFTTPSNKKSSTANQMTDRTSFCRIRIDGKKFKVLYTTETADDLSYAYYAPSKDELYIAILEGSELYSYNVLKGKVVEIASDVTSAVFSESLGQGTGADPYIFYTQTPGEEYLTQNGSMVYRTDVKGKGTKQISSGTTITLNANVHGYLYFTENDKIYRSTTLAGLDRSTVVSYGTLKTVMFTADGGVIGSGTSDSDNKLVYYVWGNNGSKIKGKILATASNYTAYFVDGDVLYGINADKKPVKLTLDDGETETASSTVIVDKATINIGKFLNAEKIGDYFYYYTETKTTDKNGNEISTWDINSIKI